jgi:hypothetical protein
MMNFEPKFVGVLLIVVSTAFCLRTLCPLRGSKSITLSPTSMLAQRRSIILLFVVFAAI